MKTTTYLIDDEEGLKKTCTKEELKYLDNINRFKVYYTLQENEEGIKYQLEDMQGNKLNINMLNGYQKEFLNVCLKCFNKGENITEEYKDFIKILDTPREIKHTVNERYEIFKEYAKNNGIEENTLNYINFIDKYSAEYEKTYNESCLNNPNKFDSYLKEMISEQTNEIEEEECM